MNSVISQIERGHIKEGYWEKTICIDTEDIKAMDFDLSLDQKNKLMQNA